MGPTAPRGMTLSCDVAIIGGGVGGLTVASSLAQRSISAMVFEQDNEVREIGAGAGTAPGPGPRSPAAE